MLDLVICVQKCEMNVNSENDVLLPFTGDGEGITYSVVSAHFLKHFLTKMLKNSSAAALMQRS